LGSKDRGMVAILHDKAGILTLLGRLGRRQSSAPRAAVQTGHHNRRTEDVRRADKSEHDCITINRMGREKRVREVYGLERDSRERSCDHTTTTSTRGPQPTAHGRSIQGLERVRGRKIGDDQFANGLLSNMFLLFYGALRQGVTDVAVLAALLC
jgi:hypothetical protein